VVALEISRAVNKKIGHYLKEHLGCAVRFRITDIAGDNPPVAVEIIYPAKYRGMGVGIPAYIIKPKGGSEGGEAPFSTKPSGLGGMPQQREESLQHPPSRTRYTCNVQNTIADLTII
jgi:hypothetical protein